MPLEEILEPGVIDECQPVLEWIASHQPGQAAGQRGPGSGEVSRRGELRAVAEGCKHGRVVEPVAVLVRPLW